MKKASLLETTNDNKAIVEEIEGRIRSINKKLKLSLTYEDVMKKARISIFTYRSWRQGVRNPSKPSLNAIAGVLKGLER